MICSVISYYMITPVRAFENHEQKEAAHHAKLPEEQTDIHNGEKKHDEGNANAGHEHGEQGHEEEGLDISQEAIDGANIELLKAGPQKIAITRKVIGKIVPNANKTILIYPRYTGLVKRLGKQLGDKVDKGDILAVIESNNTLQQYEIKAPFSGRIVKKLANAGEQVKIQTPIFQLADLSTVWCDLFIYRKDAKFIKQGQKIFIRDEDSTEPPVASTISYVSPLGVEHNQTMLARAVLNNKKNHWLPGLYVDALVVVKEEVVKVAVKADAIQEVEGEKVVFLRTEKGFEPKHCEIGLNGYEYVEVKKCIHPGETYAGKNSYLLKAHLGKEGASHEH